MGVAKTLSRLKVKRLDTLLLAIFYAVAGAAYTYMLALANFRFMPAGAFAALSFIAAYGLFTTKKWAVWIVTILFFPAATFAGATLYFSIHFYTFYPSVEILLLHLSFIFYVILSFIAFIYAAAKRKTFQ